MARPLPTPLRRPHAHPPPSATCSAACSSRTPPLRSADRALAGACSCFRMCECEQDREYLSIEMFIA
uniref:Uncharacterized protein n=1 Tax=Oryza nivara TaxID=4536 RepID=A0A0E0J7B5_ORYNI